MWVRVDLTRKDYRWALWVPALRVRLCRRVDGLACKPGSNLRPTPSFERVACEQSTEKKVRSRIEIRRQVHSACYHMDLKRLLIHARETSAAGHLLQHDHSETPPIGGRAHRADHGLGRRISGDLQWSDGFQIVIGQSRRSESCHR